MSSTFEKPTPRALIAVNANNPLIAAIGVDALANITADRGARGRCINDLATMTDARGLVRS